MTPESKKLLRKQLGIFLLICLPISWGMMGISYAISSENKTNIIASILLIISMFMPAIAGILTCVISKEGLRSLQMLPQFRENKWIYVIATAMGILLSCASELFVILVFPEVQKISENAMPDIVFIIMLSTMLGCMQSFLLLGEEIGWMGYLYPKLERLYGTTHALIYTGLIRGLWHVVMFVKWEDAAEGVRAFLLLCVSNILLGSVLVLLTKASKSVVPAAIAHSLTNSVPIAIAGFMVMDETLYAKHEMAIRLVEMVPGLIIGSVCYVILIRKFKSLNFCLK